jgi:hypothetical protein
MNKPIIIDSTDHNFSELNDKHYMEIYHIKELVDIGIYKQKIDHIKENYNVKFVFKIDNIGCTSYNYLFDEIKDAHTFIDWFKKEIKVK